MVRPSSPRLVPFVLAVLLTLVVGPAWGLAPELPRVLVDTTLIPPTGMTIPVFAGGNLQAALDAAHPGDVITLERGAMFAGPFTLPNKTGPGWITLRTSAPDSSTPQPDTLPSSGTRVGPSDAPVMPKILGNPAGNPALKTAPGAHHFRFIGIEFLPAPGTYNFGLIMLGTGTERSLDSLPHDIILDRCYIHGDPGAGGKRGVALNAKSVAIIDSYLSDWKSTTQDAQAVMGSNGPGPFKIANNYLEASGENVMFGGADPKIRNLVPSDIEIRNNQFSKPLTWNKNSSTYGGTDFVVKNLFELKNAQRVLIDGNLFEHNWVDDQAGFAIQFTVRNQDGTARWSVVQDVTFTNNLVRHAGAGINLLGFDTKPSQQTKRILIKDNLFDDLGGVTWGRPKSRLLQFIDGTADVTVDHNTGFPTGAIVFAEGPHDHTGFRFTNNIVRHNGCTGDNECGVSGTGTTPGTPTLDTYFPGAVFSRNVLIFDNTTTNPFVYPADNFPFETLSGVNFVNAGESDYRLCDVTLCASASGYKDRGTDGSDVGGHFDARLFIATPADASSVSSIVTFIVTSNNPGSVTRTDFLVDGTVVGTVAGLASGFSWDSRAVADGTHALAVATYDTAGHPLPSDSVWVTVRNTSP